jgi:hypothetical protein
LWHDSRSVRSIPTCTRIVSFLRFPVELPCPQDRLLPDFFFGAQRPQIAGMTATQKGCAAGYSRYFFAQMPKGFEDIFGNSESIGKSVRREILAQDKT